MRRRFTRRARGLWIPSNTSFSDTNALVTTGATAYGTQYFLQSPVGGDLDAPANLTSLASPTGSLALVSRPVWMLKRIVGHVFCRAEEAAASTNYRFAFFGIIKDRVDETGQADISKWDPFSPDSSQLRWLFRRTWMLEGGGAFGAPTLGSTNDQKGDVRSGPFIDCKMKARVEYGERVFLVMGVQNGPVAAATNTRFFTQLRIFANTGLQGGQT